MARFNPDFWEIPAQSRYFENIPTEQSIWFETEEDRERRHAIKDFFKSVLPVVEELIESSLTGRQKEVLRLYYFNDMSQEEIAEALALSQSTVSRHLFGTTRNGKKVGGAIPKLQKVIANDKTETISTALGTLRSRLYRAA